MSIFYIYVDFFRIFYFQEDFPSLSPIIFFQRIFFTFTLSTFFSPYPVGIFKKTWSFCPKIFFTESSRVLHFARRYLISQGIFSRFFEDFLHLDPFLVSSIISHEYEKTFFARENRRNFLHFYTRQR